MSETHNERVWRIAQSNEPIQPVRKPRAPEVALEGFVWVLYEVIVPKPSSVIGVYSTADAAEEGAQDYIEAATLDEGARQWNVDEVCEDGVWVEFKDSTDPNMCYGYGWSDGWRCRIRSVRVRVDA